MSRTRAAAALLLTLSIAPVPASAQMPDPKEEFVLALSRFSLDLSGSYGDEGPRIGADIEQLRQALSAWDREIGRLESTMRQQLPAATSGSAALMHTAFAGVLLDRGRTADALSELATAAALDPSRPEIAVLTGLAHLRSAELLDAATSTRERARAIDAMRTAAALDPANPARAYVLARQLAKTGHRDEALELFQRLADQLTLDAARRPRLPRAALFVPPGLVPESPGVQPFFPPVLYADGFDLVQRGEYEAAIEAFESASARDPFAHPSGSDDPEVERGGFALRDGQTGVALEIFKRVSDRAPDRAEMHRLLGRAYLIDEQYEPAIKEFERSVAINPDDERARLDLGEALIAAGREAEAETALKRAVELLPRSARAVYALGRLHRRQNRHSEAIQEFTRAAAARPLLGLNGLYEDIGRMQENQQQLEAAADAFAKRAELAPNDPAAHNDLGETLAKLDVDAEALAEYAIAAALDPSATRAYASIARLRLRRGELETAANAARVVLQLDGDHRQAHYMLGTALLRLGREREGREELEKFQRLETDAAAAQSRQFELDALWMQARASTTSGDYEKAVGLLQQVLEARPDVADVHVALGQALMKVGRYAEALERFKSAEVLHDEPLVHRYLADAYAALGQAAQQQREESEYERRKQERLRRAGARR
jgi:tetratricopeptide (TPR) repeat protein